MLDYLLLNKEKYYPTSSNRVIPRKVKILPGAFPGNSDTFASSESITDTYVLDCYGMVVKNYQNYGKVKQEIHYYVPGHMLKTDSYPDGYSYDWVKGDDKTVIPIY